MRGSLAIGATVAAGVIVATILVMVHTAWANGRCCETDWSYEGCNGCVSIGAGYVHVGSNSVSVCHTTAMSKTCDESPTLCFSLVNAIVYSAANCTTQIGFASVSNSVPQCDGNDDTCESG